MSLGRRLGRLARGFVSSSGMDESPGVGAGDRLGDPLGERFDERLWERMRERSDTFWSAFGAARRGFAEEWRAAEERHAEERAAHERAAREHEQREAGAEGQRSSAGPNSSSRRFSDAWRDATGRAASSAPFVPRKYPPEVLFAYHRLGLQPGEPLEAVNRKRRGLIKRHHPDRFVDPDQRARAERLTAEINAAHDQIERHLVGGSRR